MAANINASSHPKRTADRRRPHIRPMKDKVDNVVKRAMETISALTLESLGSAMIFSGSFGQRQQLCPNDQNCHC